ncbi:hypothetical protein [Mucilaginibacter sp. L196]|uniref:hypothetical protein n=1 Tax=Mucilaginibacter sp. L196 TaxID=1641870 RepID=UPI00131D04E0|nr:hypothetical protein [Mucilaginibacter sp. L196]
MKKFNGRSIIWVCLLVVFYAASRMIYTAIHDPQTTTKTQIRSYDNLFAKQIQGQLRFYSTIISEHRQPESLYIYNGKYHIIVYSVLLSHALKIGNIVNYTNESSRININAIYNDRFGLNYEMNIRVGNTDTISKVNFKFDGDLIKPIAQNDSLLCYYYKFKTFSLSYNNQDDTYDIIAKANDSAIPANIEFIRKGKILYILILTTANGTEQMPPELLYNITNV